MGEEDNAPLTGKEVIAWGGAAVALISIVVSGVVSFCRLEGRCDLGDQGLATLRSEASEHQALRDKEFDSLNNRCDALEHNFADLTHTLSDLQSSLAVLRSRQDDSLILLKKIDDKVNAAR